MDNLVRSFASIVEDFKRKPYGLIWQTHLYELNDRNMLSIFLACIELHHDFNYELAMHFCQCACSLIVSSVTL